MSSYIVGGFVGTIIAQTALFIYRQKQWNDTCESLVSVCEVSQKNTRFCIDLIHEQEEALAQSKQNLALLESKLKAVEAKLSDATSAEQRLIQKNEELIAKIASLEGKRKRRQSPGSSQIHRVKRQKNSLSIHLTDI